MKIKQYYDPLPGGDIRKPLGIIGIDNQRAFDIRHRPVSRDVFSIRVCRSNRFKCNLHGDLIQILSLNIQSFKFGSILSSNKPAAMVNHNWHASFHHSWSMLSVASMQSPSMYQDGYAYQDIFGVLDGCPQRL